jgi:hypothetical protein
VQDFSLGKNVRVKIQLRVPLDSNTYVLSRFGTQSASQSSGTSTYCGMVLSTGYELSTIFRRKDPL